MGKITYFLSGALFFAACSGAEIVFPYKWYHASPIAVWEFPDAKLLGEKPEDDKLLADCKPVKVVDGEGKEKLVQKCGVIFLDEMERLIADYKQSKQRIIDLERNCSTRSQ